jgi:hypothetical protein
MNHFYYAIFIMLSMPASAPQITPAEKIFFLFLLSVFQNPYLSMDSKRKPATIDLSQPEWTFSDNALEQYLFQMKG